MKVIIEKSKIRNDKYPKSVDINKEEITDKNIIAETFNKFEINVGSNLSGKIQPKFWIYPQNITTVLSDKSLTKKEFKYAMFTLKTNKSLGYDNFHVNVIRNMYHQLKVPLVNIFSQSLSRGISHDKMEI